MIGAPLVATSCPLCGASAAKEVIAVADPFVAADVEFPIGECASCGLARTLAGPNEAERKTWYARHYGAFLAEAHRRQGRLRRLWQKITNMHPYDILSRMPSSGRLLEVGCGDGILLQSMARRAQRAVGVEPDPGSAARARSRGLCVVSGNIEDFDAGTEKFDHVLFGFVLEHLADPVGTLLRARSWLAPGGRVHVFCPDYESPFKEELGKHWQLWHVPYQRVFFSARTLAATLAKAGLRTLSMKHYTRGGVLALGESLAAGSRGIVPRTGRLHELKNRLRGIAASRAGKGDCLAATATAAQDPGVETR